MFEGTPLLDGIDSTSVVSRVAAIGALVLGLVNGVAWATALSGLVAPELLPTVYELFTQAELPPERGEGRLGLGLDLAKRLTGMQGGSVDVASTGPGQGSSFTVVPPLASTA